MKTATPSTIELLLQLLDQAYDRKSWHGPNLKSVIRRVDAEAASYRPGPNRHSIADIVVHCAYWKYAARRRLRGDKRGSFPLKGSNWFKLPERLDEPAWKGFLKLLDDEHRQLRQAVEELRPADLAIVPPGSRITNLMLLQGMAFHDVYHAGQIQLLKRAAGDKTA